MKGLANGLYYLFEWITRFAYLNLMWICFSILGLILLGFIPSTVAMFEITRKWNRGEYDIRIFNTFWRYYKKDFLRANLIGYVFLLIGYILSIEFQILRANSSAVYFIASYGVVALFILYFITLLYFFPIFVHFNLKLYEYIKWPFIIGIIHPILTLFLSVVICIICYVIFQMSPILLFLFGGSGIAFIVMWGASKTFSKYEYVYEGEKT